jgi:hypothetical protein
MRISRLLCCLVPAVVAATGCAAQRTGARPEIASFRLTERSGFVSVHARYDEDETERTGQGVSTVSELVFQEEIGLDTESYVYHPNFLVMNLSGGLLFDQRRNEANSLSVTAQAVTWNLGARLNFLRRKPYPFSLFFERRNPLVSAGIAGSFTREITRYGVSANVLRPFSPVRLEMEAYRNVSEGAGAGQVVDETVDFFGLRGWREFSPTNQVRLTYELTRTASASGARTLPIVATDRTDQYLNLDSRVAFGDRKQFRLNNISTYRLFDDPDRTDFRYTPTLRWEHSDRLDSYYNLRLGESTQPEGDSTERGGEAGFNLTMSEDLSFSGDVHGEITKEPARFENRNLGAAAGVRYRRPIPLGELATSHSLGYDRNEQEAVAASSSVIGERLTLPGVTPVDLARERVIASSVQISNSNRSQVFVEGIDYQLLVTGTRTSVQRIPGGAIVSGENVLADYQFELQGTFSYNEFSNSHNVDVTLARYYGVFARYRGQHQSIESGTPTSPLNPANVFEVGARADVPVGSRFTVAGEIRYLRQDEEISPFDRLSLDASVSVKLPLRSQLTVSGRRVVTDQELSDEDTDLVGFGANLSSRPVSRLNLSAVLDHEEDSGGSRPRTATNVRLRGTWGIRRLRMSAEAGYLREGLPGFDRDDLSVRFTARRDFW